MMFTDQMWNSQKKHPLRIFKRILPCAPVAKGLNRKRWRYLGRQMLRKPTSDPPEEGPSRTMRGCSWRRLSKESMKVPKRQVAALPGKTKEKLYSC